MCSFIHNECVHYIFYIHISLHLIWTQCASWSILSDDSKKHASVQWINSPAKLPKPLQSPARQSVLSNTSAIWLTVIFGGGFVAINPLFAVWAFSIHCPVLFANQRDMPLNSGERWWSPWPRPLGSETGCHEAHTVSYEIRGICKKLGGLQKSWAMNITEGSYTDTYLHIHI